MTQIKLFRNDKDLTVKKLSEMSGVATGYLSDLENGKKHNPSKETMEKIAKALGRTVPEVFYSS